MREDSWLTPIVLACVVRWRLNALAQDLRGCATRPCRSLTLQLLRQPHGQARRGELRLPRLHLRGFRGMRDLVVVLAQQRPLALAQPVVGQEIHTGARFVGRRDVMGAGGTDRDAGAAVDTLGGVEQ